MNFIEFNKSLHIKPSMLGMLEFLGSDLKDGDSVADRNSFGVFGNFTIDPIETPIRYFLKRADISDLPTFGNFDDIAGNLKNLEKKSIAFYIFSLESITLNFPSKLLDRGIDWLEELIDSKMNELAISLSDFDGTLVFGWFSNSEVYSEYNKKSQMRLIDFLAKRLEVLAAQNPNVQIIDLQNQIACSKTKRVYRLEKYFSDFSVLDLQGLIIVSQAIVRHLLVKREPLIKVICVDADNTLWGGVVGEVGSSKIGISTNSLQDSIFHEVQTLLKHIKKYGVVLCMITKNEPSDIEDIFQNNANMVLEESDFAVVDASWAPKSSSIAAVAGDLDLSLDSFYFIDDSPIELLDVSESHPMVRKLLVDGDPLAYLFDMYSLYQIVESQYRTKNEDRTLLYKQRAAVKQLEKKSHDRESFLRSLKTSVRVLHNDREQVNRISELTQRTNQFNFSLNRYTATDISKLLDDDSVSIWLGEVFDRFGSHGNSICAITRRNGRTITFDSFLASCRILGREIETEFLLALCEELSHNDVTRVELTYSPGPRNAQISDYMARIKERVECDLEGNSLTINLPLKNLSKRDYVETEFLYEK